MTTKRKAKPGGRYLARWRAAKLKEESMSDEERTYRERLTALTSDIRKIQQESYFMSAPQINLALAQALARSEELAAALAPLEDLDPLGYAVGAKEAAAAEKLHQKALRESAEAYAEEVDDVGE